MYFCDIDWNLVLFWNLPSGCVSKFERKSRLSKRLYKENVTIFL